MIPAHPDSPGTRAVKWVCVRVGVHSVAYAFPKVHLVTTAVDPDINDQFYILPGIGKYHYRVVI